MGIHAGAEEVLASADSHHAVVVGRINRVDGRLGRGPFYLYAVLAANNALNLCIRGGWKFFPFSRHLLFSKKI